jgi:phosphoserine phosphatase
MPDHSHVLTLIGNPETELTAAHIETARAALTGVDALTAEPYWLDNGVAADLPFSGPPAGQAAAAARAALDGTGLDLGAQAAKHRRKRLFLADMDSTIIRQECIDEIAHYAGVADRIAEITRRAMEGDLDFEGALSERVAMLAGLEESVLERTFKDRIALTDGARAAIRTMRANGTTTVLVSGGFTFFTERVAAAAGFDAHRANTLLIDGGKLTGEVELPILGRQAKLETLQEWREKMRLDAEATMAVGDGANDLAMIGAAGLGVAFHAKPVVAEAAPVRIDHADLTALLYLQGYSREEIVSE